MDFSIVSQKTVFKSKLFEIKETDIKIDKVKKLYNDVYRKATVVIFPLTDSYEIYLISQYRHIHKKHILGAVAGFVEDGESTLETAKRELKEEAGISANHWEEIARVEMAASVVKGTAHLFLAKGLEIGEPSLEEDEDIALVKMPLKEAVEKAASGEINIGAYTTGILLLDKLRREKKI